jgi:hypothetical protein
MNLFNSVDFGPEDVRAAMTGDGRSVLAVLTSQTCGEPCWHAKEDICRCSCGGRNHGCLNHGGEQPVRAARIDGVAYKLAGVGSYRELCSEAKAINLEQWKSVDKPYRYEDWWVQYKYHWNDTDAGAPARLKPATAQQRAKWPELAAWRDQPHVSVYLFWRRESMPPKPALVVSKLTGEPLPNQRADYREP